MSENEIQTKTGTVVKRKFGAGSKSEHLAYFLITDGGEELVLRRRNANPFIDSFFEGYMNRKVECSGIVEDYILFLSDNKIKEV